MTFAYDSGTVWSRYLVIVMLYRSAEFLLGAIFDEELFALGNGRDKFTSENVQWVLSRLVEDLRNRGITVGATVADNAANFQSIVVNVERK